MSEPALYLLGLSKKILIKKLEMFSMQINYPK